MTTMTQQLIRSYANIVREQTPGSPEARGFKALYWGNPTLEGAMEEIDRQWRQENWSELPEGDGRLLDELFGAAPTPSEDGTFDGCALALDEHGNLFVSPALLEDFKSVSNKETN